ncbi:MAG: hypothetical protein GY832_20070 [Chloroflexi bacterium]|nr:hypothetical protein [Chloroflexota bacterium]
MKIFAIKTQKGYYITDDVNADRWHKNGFVNLFFDGEKPKPTFHKSWCFIPKEPTKIERLVPQDNTNHRYELIDPSMVSDKFPAIFQRDEVATYVDYEWAWCEEYKHLRSLYKPVSDSQPDVMKNIQFIFEVILELNEIVEFNGFSYPAQTGRYRSDGMGTITQDNARNQILDRILFPAIVLPMKPCRLSSKESYQIVREYIKQHINLNVAEITSDYNFCFTVERRVLLRDPYTSRREIKTARGKSYKKRRYRETYVKSRSVEVFEMTWSPENYKGYTPIKGFEGKSWDDLKAQVDTYCQELIEIINKPIKDCPHCNGMGVLEANKE